MLMKLYPGRCNQPDLYSFALSNDLEGMKR